MQISLHEKGLQMNDEQKGYVTEKIEHLKHYSEKLNDESTQARIDVEYHHQKSSGDNVTVQVTLSVPHALIRAEVSATTVEEAVDLAVEKLKKQVERYKAKKNRRDKSGKWIPVSTLEEISAASDVGESVSAIFKRKSFGVTAMHEEEATEQLGLLGHQFFAFKNVATGRFNVVYLRDDGSHGLLDFSEEERGE